MLILRTPREGVRENETRNRRGGQVRSTARAYRGGPSREETLKLSVCKAITSERPSPSGTRALRVEGEGGCRPRKSLPRTKPPAGVGEHPHPKAKKGMRAYCRPMVAGVPPLAPSWPLLGHTPFLFSVSSSPTLPLCSRYVTCLPARSLSPPPQTEEKRRPFLTPPPRTTVVVVVCSVLPTHPRPRIRY